MPRPFLHYLSLPLPSGVSRSRTSPARSGDSRRQKEGGGGGAGAEGESRRTTNFHTEEKQEELEEPRQGVEPGSPDSFIYKVGVQLSHQGRVLEVLAGLEERSCGEPGEWTSTLWRFWFWRLLKVFREVQVESWLMSDAGLVQSGLWGSLSRDTERKEPFDWRTLLQNQTK